MGSTASVRLDDETRERLDRLASTRQRSPDGLMREAIEQYVAREERRQNTRDEVLAAWDAFKSDGLHATADEVDAWLARLEAGEDGEPPQCHV